MAYPQSLGRWRVTGFSSSVGSQFSVVWLLTPPHRNMGNDHLASDIASSQRNSIRPQAMLVVEPRNLNLMLWETLGIENTNGSSSLQVKEQERRFNQTRIIDESFRYSSMTGVDTFKITPSLMSRKTTRLSKLDASVLEAQMRCGTEWPIGLVDAIAEAHRTTVQCVEERQRILRSIEQNDEKLTNHFWLIYSLCHYQDSKFL